MKSKQPINPFADRPYQSARKALLDAYARSGFFQLKAAMLEKSLSLPPGVLTENYRQENELSTESVENQGVEL